MTVPHRIFQYLDGQEADLQKLSAWLQQHSENAQEFVISCFVDHCLRESVSKDPGENTCNQTPGHQTASDQDAQSQLPSSQTILPETSPPPAVPIRDQSAPGPAPGPAGVDRLALDRPVMDRPVLEQPKCERSELGRVGRWSLSVGGLLLAAAVLWGVVTMIAGSGKGVRLVASVEANWANSLDLQPGQWMPKDPCFLEEGLALVRFPSGATVVLEGPCRFQIDGEKQLLVNAGAVAVRCQTKESYGFCVQTPSAQVVDLGTEFAVRVFADGSCETHVFDGEIELLAVAELRPAVLRRGEAASVSASGQAVDEFSADSSSFARWNAFALAAADQAGAIPPQWSEFYRQRSADSGLVFWSDFNPVSRELGVANLSVSLESRGWFVEGRSFPGRFAAGRFPSNQALAAFQTADVVAVEIPGRFEKLTMAAWIRLSEPLKDGNLHRGLLLSAWQTPGHVHWQWKAGGFRLTYPLGQGKPHARFQTPAPQLQDGRWHLLTSVYDANAQMVWHYVDGGGVAQLPVEPTAALPLKIGRATIGGWSRDAGRPWGGEIDDLMIWSRALGPAEVEDLYRQSRWEAQP